MPSRAPRIKTIRRSKREHRRRGTSCKRGYDRHWRRTRKAKLDRDPLCQDCLDEEFITEADDVHHIEKIEDRPDLRLDIDNLRSLCKSHHSIRTARGE